MASQNGKPSPVISRKRGFLSVGEKPTDLISFYGRQGVAQPANTLSSRAVLESLGLVASGGAPGGTPTAVVATSDGLTTGIIPNSSEAVIVTSASSSNIVTLPAPTPGRSLRIIVGANGCKLVTTAPASIAINGGTGASAKSTIGANVVLFLTCVDATHWTGYQTSTVGAVTAIAVAA